MIGFLREELRKLPQAETSFPIILQRVIFSGSHTGDEIPVGDVPKLKNELELLAKFTVKEDVKEFVQAMKELCAASLLTENPIVF
jgi:hypothetical protein